MIISSTVVLGLTSEAGEAVRTQRVSLGVRGIIRVQIAGDEVCPVQINSDVSHGRVLLPVKGGQTSGDCSV